MKDGLITHQLLSEHSKLQEPLYIDANYKYTTDTLNLNNGIIYFYLEDYKKLVFEIRDEFKPKNAYDIGGISVVQGHRTHNLYQYENDTEDIDYKRSRVTKIINSYYGEGSENNESWYDKGSRFLSNAELIGITYESYDNTFPLNEIKIYKDPSWYIYGLYEGCKLEVYNKDETELLYDIVIDRTNIAKLTNKTYPINCKIKGWNTDNEQVLDFILSDIWGGDEYYMSIDVELYNHERVLLYLEEAKHLGIVRYAKPLRELIYIVNNGNTDIPVTLRISPESPAYNWVELEYLDYRGKEIIIPLSALGEDEFYIVIVQPDSSEVLPTDYAVGEEYVFYLEVL